MEDQESSSRHQSELGKQHFISVARNMLLNLENRNVEFESSSLFSNPSWEILLQVFVTTIQGVGFTLPDENVKSDVPRKVLLRYLQALEDRSLVEKYWGEFGTENEVIKLTDTAMTKMISLISKVDQAPSSRPEL
jgi:hypothetical protein